MTEPDEPRASRPGDRFVDTGKRLASFADEVLVRCVQCGTAGTVHATWQPYGWDARFACTRCDLVLSSALGHWVGPVRIHGRRPCGYCGHQWLAPSLDFPKPPNDPPTRIEASCPACGRSSAVDVVPSKAIPADRCCDPHFGLPLRLTTRTRHGTVWAYNRAHLDELSGYVGAKLRERRNAGNSALFSRLPKWMKLAKNRDGIAKALQKLKGIG